MSKKIGRKSGGYYPDSLSASDFIIRFPFSLNLSTTKNGGIGSVGRPAILRKNEPFSLRMR